PTREVTPEPTLTLEPTIEVTPEPTLTVEPTREVTPEPTLTLEPTIEVTPEPTLTVEPTIEVTPEIQPIITPNQNEGLISRIEGETHESEPTETVFGTINLMEQPENIEVYINGEPQGETPLLITGVHPGEYLITFEHDDGYEDQIVEIPETGGEIKPEKIESVYKISVLAGEKEPCKDCCTIQEVHARTSTRDYSEVFKISTIAMKTDESGRIPYTLYWNSKPWYKGTLKPDVDEKAEGCENCMVMEDYIREVTPPGTFELVLDDGRLCTSSDNQGRLSFFGTEDIPITSNLNEP
ncbi:PEGA domain-containing protein, partial [Methanospirillum purgamenti]